MISTAIISDCELYRYELRKIWQPKNKWVCFIMLNPSIADSNIEDPTIRRCMGFAEKWGYGGITVANLFAFRSTDSNKLFKVKDPIGSENNFYIFKLSSEADLTICGWGNKGLYFNRWKTAFYLIKNPKHLGLTKMGQPKHPLYLKKNILPKDYKI